MNRRRSAWIVCLLVFLSGCDQDPQPDKGRRTRENQVVQQPVAPASSGPDAVDREFQIARSERLSAKGDLPGAVAALQTVLLGDPDDAEVLFRTATLQALQGNLLDAIDLLEMIPEDDPDAGLPALGQSADWHLDLASYDAAEEKYLKVVARAPEFSHAHRQLAYLYNRQGRRHEAVHHIRRLCVIGDVRQDELHALMIANDAIFDDPRDPGIRNKERTYFPIGAVAEARVLFTAKRYGEACDVLKRQVDSGGASPSTLAFYGRLLMESQDEASFLRWLTSVRDNDVVQTFPDYWAALGTYLLGQHRHAESIRSFLEVLDRDPTDLSSIRRLNQSLQAVGRHEDAERWVERFSLIRETTLASNAIGERPDAASFRTIINGLTKLGRRLEAVCWSLLEAYYRNASEQELQSVVNRRSAIPATDYFPSRSMRLCGLDSDRFPLPEIHSDIAISEGRRRTVTEANSSPQPRFINVAGQIGLSHQYQVASAPQPFRFALFQSLGGGAAAWDYNLDGQCDFYLAQGQSDPPELISQSSNQCYLGGDGKVHDVTASARMLEFGYTIGVTTGDWNQDGFPDLAYSNIGMKVLMLNRGDGTFKRMEFDRDADGRTLPSSVAMGDLTGDAIPDLFSLHYVEDAKMLKRPGIDASGNVEIVSPLEFEPGYDRLAVNDGTGQVKSSKLNESDTARSTGLGVVIADWNGKPGNEIFVGNDIRENQMWVRDTSGGDWNDVAPAIGCAHGYGGAETASMGLAVADFDGSGTLDIHITNFYQEPVSLFLNRGGLFEDRCIQFGLQQDSLPVLGFGCQAVDYDNDGYSDIAVTNGHIEKSPGEPLKQSPQFFANLGNRFKLTTVDDASGYWDGLYLGRGMARCDFNRDGQGDLLITHIGSPTALLINQTETSHHWLDVHLVGTKSERDATGTRVEVRSDELSLSNWLVGGDGYLCRNEAAVTFGLGSVAQIDAVIVTWPSGAIEEFRGIPVDRQILLIEGEPNPHVFERKP